MERPNGGFGRGFSQGNGIEAQQAPIDRPQPDRQGEEWSLPTNIERRENSTERHETSQAPPSNVPPPTEDRLFTDWSSNNSPRARETQCNLSTRSGEPNTIQTVNQTEQPEMNPTRNEVMENILSDVMTMPSTHRQLSQVDTRFVDRETNISEFELRPQREETRINILSDHSRDIQIPTSCSGISSHEIDVIRGSPVGLCATDIPQLDGPTSVCRRPEQEFIQQTTTIPRGGYPDESDSDSHDNRRPHDGHRSYGRRRQYHDRSGRPPDRGNDCDRGYSRRVGPLIMVNPLMMEDCLMMEDPLEMEEI